MFKKLFLTALIATYYSTLLIGQATPCTKFGVLVNGASFTDQQKASISASLNAEYVRENIKLSTFTGVDASYDVYLLNGFKVISNLSWDNAGSYTSSLTLYGQKISQVLANYQPEIVVIENEELNPNFHPNGTAKRYIDMLMTASPIVHAAGLKITNGGIYGTALFMLIYRDLYTNFSPSAATIFGNNSVLNAGQVSAAQVPNSNPTQEARILTMDSIVNAIGLYCDYANIHFYIDTLAVTSQSVWPEIQAYFKRRMNKQCITNETCIRNTDMVHWVTETLNTYKNTFTPYILWYSQDDPMAGARSLNDYPSGILRPTGIEFKNNILVPNPNCGSVGNFETVFEKNEFTVFPNPFSNKITLQNKSTVMGNYKLMNAIGQTIWEGKNIEDQNFSEFPIGIYFLILTDQNATQMAKLIKQ